MKWRMLAVGVKPSEIIKIGGINPHIFSSELRKAYGFNEGD